MLLSKVWNAKPVHGQDTLWRSWSQRWTSPGVQRPRWVLHGEHRSTSLAKKFLTSDIGHPRYYPRSMITMTIMIIIIIIIGHNFKILKLLLTFIPEWALAKLAMESMAIPQLNRFSSPPRCHEAWILVFKCFCTKQVDNVLEYLTSTSRSIQWPVLKLRVDFAVWQVLHGLFTGVQAITILQSSSEISIHAISTTNHVKDMALAQFNSLLTQ